MSDKKTFNDLAELLDCCQKLDAQDEVIVEMDSLENLLHDNSNDVIIETQRLLFPFNCSVYLQTGR